MKKIPILAIWACFFAALLCMPQLAEAADSVQVKVCGESFFNEADAVTDAKQKAATKVLKKMLGSDDDPDSVYQQILSNGSSYIDGVHVFSKEAKDGKYLLFSQVDVNAKRMHDDVQKKVQNLQKKNGDAQTSFLLRVQGLPDGQRLFSQKKLSVIFNTTFQKTGFQTTSVDELLELIKAKQGDIFPMYWTTFCQKIHQDYPEVGNLILGEVVVTENVTDANGTTISGIVQLIGVDYLKNKKLTDGTQYAFVQERFTARDTDPQRALEIFLYKVGLNTSRAVAAKTLSYWQN